MPFFSIVIPIFNKEKFIARTLQSVLSQTFGDYEILIVNDGSTDSSREIIMAFNDSRIRYFQQQNSGVSSARNFGIASAKSNYIAFLDADDFWYPDYLANVQLMISRHPEQKIFSTAYEIETADTVYPVRYSVQNNSEVVVVDYFDASQRESILWTSSAVFDKAVFADVGVFDPEIRVGEDIDLWIRMGLKYRIVFSPKVLARYTYDAKSLTKNLQLTVAEANFSKFSELEPTNPKLKKYLDRNRFSLAIKAKLLNDRKLFEKFYREIDLIGIGVKKKVLLQAPRSVLTILIKINHLLVKTGLKSSVFK